MAVAANHPPIIEPLSLGGATLLTNEMPIGERRSSAKVRSRYVEMSQSGETDPFVPTRLSDATTIRQ